jgi:hypothetical protein
VPPSVDQLRFFAGAARVLEGRSAGEYLRDHTSMIRREPIGVCAQVTPWNYPLMIAIWKIAPALAAGNAVVLKPSDTTPVSTLLLAEVAAEFFPPGVFNVVCGNSDTGRAMVAHPIPAMASITGSVRAGLEVAHTAADGLKRVHLELGGKAPVSPPTSPTPSPSRPGRPRRAASTSPTRSTARCTTPRSWPGSPASSTGCPRTRRCGPAATASPARVTCSSRPSSPASASTTR